MSGITKTIPPKDGVEAVEALYDGRVGEFEFHMAGKPRSLIYVKTPGDKLEKPYPKKGHRGTRYYDGEGWEKS